MNDIEKRKAYICQFCKNAFTKTQLNTLYWVMSGGHNYKKILCQECGMKKIVQLSEKSLNLVKLYWNG